MLGGLQELHLQHIITAIGGLGTASFGLVDAAKSTFGSINRVGLDRIRKVVSDLTPEGASAGKPVNALAQADILQTVEANWVDGTDLATQKAVAKSLVKLHLNGVNAMTVAEKVSFDAAILSAAADNVATGASLSQAENNVYARFDQTVTALLDEAYKLSDQVYRNYTRTLAAAVAVVLAIAGGWALVGTEHFWNSTDPFLALLVGLLATPLAPIAKDLSSAVATAVNTMQVVNKG